jgi:Insertion element 4 transposase N-terminal/Transposase DDE domain
MVELGEALLAVGAGTRPASFDAFNAALDPAWIAAALETTGMASVRRRKVPADYIVWLVIAMALFRDRAIAQVAQHLDLVLPTAAGPGTITPGALVQARTRLGAAPIATLFQASAQHWSRRAADAERWHGLAVYAVDGTTLRLPDSAANDTIFGRPGTSRGGPAAYPQLRLVVLQAVRSHLLADAAFGAFATSEPALAAALWAGLPDQSVVLLDRGFTSYALFHALSAPAHERHYVVRVRTGRGALRWRVHQSLGEGDELVDWRPTHLADPQLPRTLRARAIRIERRGFPPTLLLTSLLDPVRYPAAAVAALYRERWEVESTFDEVKTHTLRREETLRSQDPARVAQEVWGLLIAYNLVRVLMARAAPRARVPPVRLSYWNALLFLRTFWHGAWDLLPGTLPRHLDALLDHLALLVLPPRRKRQYPRAVKIPQSAYPRKRPRPPSA